MNVKEPTKNKNSNNPLVSIVVPCYNVSNCIEQCVDSIEKQSFKNCELICVDDCSTDDTYSILNRIKDNSSLNIIIIRLEKNSGPGIARNKGLEIARGKYIAFCDGDDTYDPSFLSKMTSKASQNDSDLVMCNCVLINDRGSSHNISYTDSFDEDSSKERYIALSRTSLCYLLVKKELFNDIEMPSFRNGEDMAIVPLLMLKANKIAHVKDHLYYYHINSTSASNSLKKESYRNLIEVYDFLNNHWDNCYQEELEFISIKTILYSAVVVACKTGISNDEIINQIKKFESIHKNWYQNKYIGELSKHHRAFLVFVKQRQLYLCKVYCWLHTVLLR